VRTWSYRSSPPTRFFRPPPAGARLLLHVELERAIPVAMKARQIPIGGAKPKVVEAKPSKAA
jgi:hypothetical protein